MRDVAWVWIPVDEWMDDDVVDVARSVAASQDGTGLVSRARWRDIAIEGWRRERMRDD